MTPRRRGDALRGSPDLLVLETLSLAPMHGWVSRRIQHAIGFEPVLGTVQP